MAFKVAYTCLRLFLPYVRKRASDLPVSSLTAGLPLARYRRNILQLQHQQQRFQWQDKAPASAADMQSARAPRALWPQLQTSELLADLQWLASEDVAPSGAPPGPNVDSSLQQQQQQLRLIQILEATNEGKDSAALAVATALFQCERQRQLLLQQVLASCLQCELLRLAFLSACSSIAPKRQQLVWSAAFGNREQDQQEQQQLARALWCSICLGAAAAASPAQLPSASQSLESYWERLRELPVVFEGGGLCELEALDVKQIEKDATRETFRINNQLIRGADGLLPLLLALTTRLREAEEAAVHALAATKGTAEETASPGAATGSFDLPETVEALRSLGWIPEVVCGTESNTSAAGATAAPATVWAAVSRAFCAIRLLSLSSRTHGGGAAFAAALRSFACPALPLLLQPDNQVAAASQQQLQQQQQQQVAFHNVNEMVIASHSQGQEGAQWPLLAILHTNTPFKLLLPEHEYHSARFDSQPQQQQQQQQQLELLKRLAFVTVDAHFFATLRGVLLQQPSAELRQFDHDLAGQVRRRESGAALVAAVLAEEMKQTSELARDKRHLLWLPAEESQQWVLVRTNTGAEEDSV